jgi:hypothetical protein
MFKIFNCNINLKKKGLQFLELGSYKDKIYKNLILIYKPYPYYHILLGLKKFMLPISL